MHLSAKRKQCGGLGPETPGKIVRGHALQIVGKRHFSIKAIKIEKKILVTYPTEKRVVTFFWLASSSGLSLA